MINDSKKLPDLNTLPLITIVVPVYNTEKYLSRCVQSILGQTYAKLEVILVDDGSTDACPSLCDAFATQDARVKVIHKKNGGLADARNTGIDNAAGEYIGFVDSDDYIAGDMYETLYRLMADGRADISICGRYILQEDRTMQTPRAPNALFAPQQALELALKGKYFDVSSADKLYHRNIFSSLRFPVGKISEDVFVVHRLFEAAHVVGFTSEPKYFYDCRHQNSISRSAFTCRRLDVLDALSEIIQYARDRKYGNILQAAKVEYTNNGLRLIKQMIECGISDRQIMYGITKDVRKYVFSFLLSRHALIKKIFAVVLLVNVPLCVFLYRQTKRLATAVHTLSRGSVR